jgi:hypothetical protein
MGGRSEYRAAAERTGRAIAAAGLRLVYGGGDVGLMGAAASAAAEAGGAVLGVIPGFLIAREGHLDGVEVRIVETMSERKRQLIEESDAYIILPGGTGTMEEIFDVVSRQQLALHDKPIVFLNTAGFWAPIIALIDHTVREGFTPQSLADHLDLADEPEAAVAHLAGLLETKAPS